MVRGTWCTAPFSDNEGEKPGSVPDPSEMDEGEKGGIPDAVEVEEMDEEVKGIDEDGGEIDQVLVLVVWLA